MRRVGSFLADYYPVNDELYPVKFFSDYFKQPIEEIDIERLHSLLSSVPVYIIYTDIRSDAVTFRVASWKMQDEQAIPFPPIEWNWREVEQKLLSEGKTEDEILSIVRSVIIKIHQVLLAFYTDIYYLSLDPYYEVRLPNIEIEKELIQPYRDRLKALQGEIREAYEQQLANRLEEEKRRIEAEKRRQEEEKGKEFFFEIIIVDHRGNIAERRPSNGFQKSENLGANIDLEMVYIPGGTFLMGSPDDEGGSDERPQHRVTVPSFYMGKYPITQAQWRFIASQPIIDIYLSPEPSHFKGDNRPVERVNWYQAVEFCKRLSKLTRKDYHLPSEAQWEYACCAGTTTPFAFGATFSTEVANYDGNYTYANGKKGTYRKETTPVGQFPPNAFGLYDMHGQVWEWCGDDWHDNYNGATEDGSAWITNKNNRSLLRGGSWRDDPVFCRSACRGGNLRRNIIGSGYGFRVAYVSSGL
jgi:formylglycine-generating enzyme required for sulfatase activity